MGGSDAVFQVYGSFLKFHVLEGNKKSLKLRFFGSGDSFPIFQSGSVVCTIAFVGLNLQIDVVGNYFPSMKSCRWFKELHGKTVKILKCMLLRAKTIVSDNENHSKTLKIS